MGTQLAPTAAPEGMQLATFAGGCFWGLELQMQRVPGVVSTSVGYTGVRPSSAAQSLHWNECSSRRSLIGEAYRVFVVTGPGVTLAQ